MLAVREGEEWKKKKRREKEGEGCWRVGPFAGVKKIKKRKKEGREELAGWAGPKEKEES